MTKTLWKCVLLISGGLFCCMIVSGGDRTRPVAERGCLPRSERYQVRRVATAPIVFEQGIIYGDGNDVGDTERATFLVRQLLGDVTETEEEFDISLDSGATLSEWL